MSVGWLVCRSHLMLFFIFVFWQKGMGRFRRQGYTGTPVSGLVFKSTLVTLPWSFSHILGIKNIELIHFVKQYKIYCKLSCLGRSKDQGNKDKGWGGTRVLGARGFIKGCFQKGRTQNAAKPNNLFTSADKTHQFQNCCLLLILTTLSTWVTFLFTLFYLFFFLELIFLCLFYFSVCRFIFLS